MQKLSFKIFVRCNLEDIVENEPVENTDDLDSVFK